MAAIDGPPAGNSHGLVPDAGQPSWLPVALAFLYTIGLVVRMPIQRHPVIASGSVRTTLTLIGSYACLRAH